MTVSRNIAWVCVALLPASGCLPGIFGIPMQQLWECLRSRQRSLRIGNSILLYAIVITVSGDIRRQLY